MVPRFADICSHLLIVPTGKGLLLVVAWRQRAKVMYTAPISVIWEAGYTAVNQERPVVSPPKWFIVIPLKWFTQSTVFRLCCFKELFKG